MARQFIFGLCLPEPHHPPIQPEPLSLQDWFQKANELIISLVMVSFIWQLDMLFDTLHNHSLVSDRDIRLVWEHACEELSSVH